MVHSSFAVRGGAERYVRDLSRGLAARGHEVRVFSRASDGSQPDDRPVPVRFFDRPQRPRKILTHLGDLVDPTGLRLRDLRGFDPDVVHVHNWQGLGVLPIARLARAYPTCHTVHDYAICDPNNALANRGRSTIVDRLLALRSAWLVRRLRAVTLLWPAERTRDIVRAHVPGAARLPGRIVPLAVPTAGQPPGPPRRRDVFLFLGALSPHKGVDLLLDAWRGAVHGTLLIAGDGPLRAEVERAGPSVRYLGYLDDAGKASALREAAWLVFPSRWPENFPISCVEALVAGRPIIANAAAHPPMAADTSVLTFRGPDDLSGVLRRAAGLSEADYRALSASAAADGRRLDWDSHVDAVLAAYGELVRGSWRLADVRPD
jgi:glycosyltransferase involved in cell wall biosynthesis